STANGLPTNWVNCVRELKSGELWIGTELGLLRKEGSQFVAFDSSPSPQAPLSSHNPSTNRAEISGDASGKSSRGSFIPGKVRQVLTGTDDRVWLLTGEMQSSGVSCLDGTNYFSLSSSEGLPSGIFELLADPDGGLWLASMQGAFHYDGTSFIAYST